MIFKIYYLCLIIQKHFSFCTNFFSFPSYTNSSNSSHCASPLQQFKQRNGVGISNLKRPLGYDPTPIDLWMQNHQSYCPLQSTSSVF